MFFSTIRHYPPIWSTHNSWCVFFGPGGLLLTDSTHQSPSYSCSSSGPPSCAALSPVLLEYQPHTCCKVTHAQMQRSCDPLSVFLHPTLSPSFSSDLPVPFTQRASVPGSLLGPEPPAHSAAVRLQEAHLARVIGRALGFRQQWGGAYSFGNVDEQRSCGLRGTMWATPLQPGWRHGLPVGHRELQRPAGLRHEWISSVKAQQIKSILTLNV